MMKCEECLPLVEDYFDGAVDEETSLLVKRHLTSCSACAIAHRRLGREQELYLSYECDVEAGHNFWDGVMARAVKESSTRPGLRSNLRGLMALARGIFAAPHFSPQLTALIVLVSIGITALLMSRPGSMEKSSAQDHLARSVEQPNVSMPPDATVEPEGTKEKTEEGGAPAKSQPRAFRNVGGKRGGLVSEASGRNPSRSSLRTPDQLVREAEQKYVAAIGLLSRDASRRRSQLDPETAARFERTLTTLDRTIAETRRAVREHPGDPLAAKYMLTAYARKVDVLREMVGY